MVALLSQCFPTEKPKQIQKDQDIVDATDLIIPEKSPLKEQEIQHHTMDTGRNILDKQFKELKEYSQYLEKEVEEYKKYI